MENKMDRNADYQNHSWPLKSVLSNAHFNAYDFIRTDFNGSSFINTSFCNCVFKKCALNGARVFKGSSFDNCVFIDTDLSKTTFGSHEGLYNQCRFIKCNIQNKEFNYTQFVDCLFEQCKLKNINFNASNFKNCKFIGKIENVTYNGIYDTNKSEFPPIDSVDFAEATLGEFVTFIQCDLSNSIPPQGTTFESILYQLYANDPLTISTGSKDRIVIKR